MPDSDRPEPATANRTPPGTVGEVLRTCTKLGLTSFGGPIAHLGYFRTEYVDRRRWLSAEEYADLVSLCQFLPGPASSQVGIAVGLKRAGIPGAIAAWCGFTLPSAIALAFALGFAGRVPAGVLHGLMIVAVAVVGQALWQMARTACRGLPEALIAAAALAASLAWRAAWVQIAMIGCGLLAGLLLFRRSTTGAQVGRISTTVSRRAGVLSLGLFVALLIALPVAARLTASLAVDVADTFYRVGSMVFGGGHVVLPLLESQVVPPGWVNAQDFVAGYGAAQAVPGPLFTFSAYLGASMSRPVLMAVIALLAIFLPSFFLVIGVLPFWDRIRGDASMRAALRGVNAAVVGVLAAAFYRPVITSAILDWPDVLIALAAFAALVRLRLPPWVVVVGTALLTWVVGVLAVV
ncbi:chromate efflux transporter [Cumulibacter manganitolerans]|uniref:chromate efflux transporter n=1 Tax=Cumulibacter manganitolerans TaxID=1884992 RepID=UPI001E57B2DD|nr:chromate efflux transporter [Cumulibacter manganitolerans]